ncbi:hypothetical protein Hamer_G028923 [Homarus americanus]|uniref:Uncharacterized protein n=1 Tax=Homarus americanus TaxID=6706 RepID=A0A8J5JEC4_HOMAM|nr:hypothetical protein Hamer_G028923 [Homarus americanus]
MHEGHTEIPNSFESSTMKVVWALLAAPEHQISSRLWALYNFTAQIRGVSVHSSGWEITYVELSFNKGSVFIRRQIDKIGLRRLRGVQLIVPYENIKTLTGNLQKVRQDPDSISGSNLYGDVLSKCRSIQLQAVSNDETLSQTWLWSDDLTVAFIRGLLL